MFSVGERSFCWCRTFILYNFKIFHLHKNTEGNNLKKKPNRCPLTPPNSETCFVSPLWTVFLNVSRVVTSQTDNTDTVDIMVHYWSTTYTKWLPFPSSALLSFSLLLAFTCYSWVWVLFPHYKADDETALFVLVCSEKKVSNVLKPELNWPGLVGGNKASVCCQPQISGRKWMDGLMTLCLWTVVRSTSLATPQVIALIIACPLPIELLINCAFCECFGSKWMLCEKQSTICSSNHSRQERAFSGEKIQ